MPYSKNEEISIYYEVEGEGPPLVLMHGLPASLEHWRQLGYVQALKDDYQLILMDARGHGNSDKPHTSEAYRLKLMVTDVIAVLNDLKIGQAHFLGYSMGGWIGWGLTKYVPERFLSLIIGGAGPPYERDESSFFPNLLRKGMDALLEAMEKVSREWWTPEFKAIIQSNDLDALIALTSGADWRGLPNFEEVLPTVTLRCLLYAGEDSGEHSSAQESVNSMPNATFVSLPNLGHVEALARKDLVLPHITEFLAKTI